MKKKQKITKYCSKCGEKCKIELVGAETVYFTTYDFGELRTVCLGEPYNTETGKRNQARKYVCPQWKKKKHWYNSSSEHDNFVVNEIIDYINNLR